MWIAREPNGQLFVYEKKPSKDLDSFLKVKYDILGSIIHEDDFTKSITFENSPIEVKFVKV